MKRAFAGLLLLAVVSSQASASAYSEFNAGIVARNRGDAAEAVRLLSLAVASPELPAHLRPIAYFDRGTVYESSKQYDLAIADLTACLALWPHYYPALGARGYAHKARKEFDLAQSDFEAVVAERPDLFDGRYALISLQLAAKKFDAALTASNDAIAAWPDLGPPLAMRAKVNRAMAKRREAIDDYSAALKKDSHLVEAFVERGATYQEMGQLKEALSDVEEAASLDTSDSNLRMQVGFLQWDLGHFHDAEQTFRKIIWTGVPTPYTFLWLYLSTAKTLPAGHIELSSGAEKIDPEKWPGPVVRMFMGSEKAEDVLKAAGKGTDDERQDQSCEAHFYLGEWQQAHGDAAGAKSQLMDAAQNCRIGFIEKQAATSDLGRLQ